MTTTREEHLKWCKSRALEYADAGDPNQAMASMASDLNKHPETQGHIGITMGVQLLLIGNLSSPKAMRDFIEGFN